MTKTIVRLGLIIISFALLSCSETRYITERHIKNNIEKHIPGEYSSIRTYRIFQGYSLDRSVYVELTGYKYKDKKALLIGTDRYYLARPKFKDDPTIVMEYSFVELTTEECKSIVDNYKTIQSTAKKEKPRKGEEIYHDFTVSNDVYISFKKGKQSVTGDLINLWVRGEKYKLQTSTLITKLNAFVKY